MHPPTKHLKALKAARKRQAREASRHPHLTIAYITGRKEPMFEWFWASLQRETGGILDNIKVVAVDMHRASRSSQWCECHVAPMPCVWQGPHRLTSKDYFAAANARNTALCYAPNGWIAYVDDLSVLMPGWLHAVREAMRHSYIALGAYRKVLGLTVDNRGTPTFKDYPPGRDSRWNKGNPKEPVPAGGQWLYGCSLALPVESLLTVGGWNSDCDGLGFEDVITGIALERAGYAFMYDLRMLTLESEERHGDGSSLPRAGKGTGTTDKGHTILNRAYAGHPHPNYFGPTGICGLRERTLRGESFTIPIEPTKDWYDDQPLSEL